jgi:hypothetical protein
MIKSLALCSFLFCATACAATLRVEVLSGPDATRLTPTLSATATSKAGEPFLFEQSQATAYVSKVEWVKGERRLTPDEIPLGFRMKANPTPDGSFLIDIQLSEFLGIAQVDAFNRPINPFCQASDYEAQRPECVEPVPIELPSHRSWSMRQSVSFKRANVVHFDRAIQNDGAPPMMQRLRLTYTQ